MNGWYLTDNAKSLKKWQFPEVTIQPGESKIVWPSSKNRTNPQGELHTSWGLSRNGEYLGLVMPDGLTIKSQFAPSFPTQFTDVSFGRPTTEDSALLVNQSSLTQVWVPTNESLGTTWTTSAFVPGAAWTSATAQGVGYDTSPDYLPLIRTDVSSMRNVNGSA